jgi:hypothetical protein
MEPIVPPIEKAEAARAWDKAIARLIGSAPSTESKNIISSTDVNGVVITS